MTPPPPPMKEDLTVPVVQDRRQTHHPDTYEVPMGERAVPPRMAAAPSMPIAPPPIHAHVNYRPPYACCTHVLLVLTIVAVALSTVYLYWNHAQTPSATVPVTDAVLLET